jgi:hypothetical protein
MIDTLGGAPGSPWTISTVSPSRSAQEVGEHRRIGDRGRQADEARLRRHRRQPGQAEREMMAALGGREGMQLVDDDAAQAGEELLGIGIAEQQRQRLRRGHQQVGRPLALAQPPALRRVAGPALGAHRQLHLGDRRLEVAADVGGQRLQGRDVERVQLALALGSARSLPARRRSVSSISDGRKPARVLPPPVGAISSALLPCRASSISASWCGRGAQPRLSNQRAKPVR